MTVYVVQDQKWVDGDSGELRSKFDFTPARRFGELEFLLRPSASPFNMEPVIEELHKRLSGYDGENDYLLLVGNPAIIGVAVAIAADYSGTVRLLQWSGARREYLPITIPDLLV